jgi:hypothetical protein
MNTSEADILRRLQREQNRLVIVTANLSRIQRDLDLDRALVRQVIVDRLLMDFVQGVR